MEDNSEPFLPDRRERLKEKSNDERRARLLYLLRKYEDIWDEKAEKRFRKDSTFLKENRFEPDEIIYYINHQSIKFTIGRLLLTIIFIGSILLTFFGVLMWISGFNDPELNFFVLLIFGILAAVFTVTGVFSVISATSYRFIITDRKIIIGYTLGARVSRTILIPNITDIIVYQSFFSRLFNTGSISIITSSDEIAIPTTNTSSSGSAANVIMMQSITNVENPFRVKSLIKELLSFYEHEEFAVPELKVEPLKNPEIPFEEVDLMPEEIVYKVYSKKTVSSFCSFLSIPIVIIVFIIQTLPNTINLITTELLIIGAGAFLLFIGIFVLIAIFVAKFHARGFVYIVTDRRIIMFKKFLTIRCRDAIIGKISDVSIKQAISGRMVNFGQIRIATKGMERLSLFHDLYSINGVEDVTGEKDDILNIVLYYQNGKMYSPMLDLIEPEFYAV